MPAALNHDLSPAGDVTECNHKSISGLCYKADSLVAGSTGSRCDNVRAPLCASHQDRLECATTENYRYDSNKHGVAYSDLCAAHHNPSNAIGDASIESVKMFMDLVSSGVDSDLKSSGETESCSSVLYPSLRPGSLGTTDVALEQSGGGDNACVMANDLNAAIKQLSIKVTRSESEGTGDSGCIDYASDYAEDFDECGLVIDTKDFDQDDFIKAAVSNVEHQHCANSGEVESSLCHEDFKNELDITLNEANEYVITSDSAVSVASDLSCDGSVVVKSEYFEEDCANDTITEKPPTAQVTGGRNQPVLECDTYSSNEIKSADIKTDEHKNIINKNKHVKHENFVSNRMLAEWPSIAKCRVGAGLQNLGNTCFVNATIQCLTYTLPLINYLFTFGDSASCAVSEMCLMCELEQHMKQCFENGGTIVKPHSILQKLKVIARHMRWGRQEDAHEFLRYMVEAMHKSCISGHQPLPENTKDVSVVNEIFGGILRSQVTCMKCSAKSNTYDPFLDISLDVKNVSTILRALERFVEPETLDTDNAYNCTQCHCKVRAQKRFTIHRLPHVLTIQLKRHAKTDVFMAVYTGSLNETPIFSGRVDGYGITGGKVTRHITFPEVLDVRPFVSTVRDNRNGNDEKPLADFKYRLYGVLVHEGHSTSSGHYYCYVSTSSGGWYCMNDHMVRRSSLNQVLNAEAYLLFYKRGVVSTASSSHGHSVSDTPLGNDIHHMLRSVPTRLCRSIDGLSRLSESASMNEEWRKSLSPERKSACLGGQQMMSCEALKNGRVQSPRLACRGGQMMLSSIKSTSAISRPIRKPQISLNVKNRKNMARYRRAIKKSCREHKKIVESACCENLQSLRHPKVYINHGLVGKENEITPADNKVATTTTQMLLDSKETEITTADSKVVNTSTPMPVDSNQGIVGKETESTTADSKVANTASPMPVDSNRGVVGKETQITPADSKVVNPATQMSVDSNHGVVSKETEITPADSKVANTATPLPRIVLKIRLGRIVDSTFKDGGLPAEPSASKESQPVDCGKVSSVSKESQPVDCGKVSSASADLCIVGKKAACTKKLPPPTSSVRSSSLTSSLAPQSEWTNGTSSYDKLSHDYFIKLSQMCASADFGNSLKVSCTSQESVVDKMRVSPCISKKTPKSLSVDKINRRATVNSTCGLHCRTNQQTNHCTSAENSSAKSLHVSQPIEDSSLLLRKTSKAGRDRGMLSKAVLDKPAQHLRGDVYDFDVGDEGDTECPSMSLAFHRQNSSSSDKDGVPAATMKTPGAYGLLTKTKKIFSNRSHAVINPNQHDSIEISRPCNIKGQTEDKKQLSEADGSRKHSRALKKVRSKTSVKRLEATGERTSLEQQVYGPKTESVNLKHVSMAKSEARCQKRNLKVNDENSATISEDSTQPFGLKRRLVIPEEPSKDEAIVATGKLKKCNYVESVASSQPESRSSPSISPAASHRESEASPAHLSFVHAVTPTPSGSSSLPSQLPVNSMRKESEPTVGPIRLKICRVSDAHLTSKIYNVVIPDQPASSSYVGDPLKRRTVSHKETNAETSGPGRGS